MVDDPCKELRVKKKAIEEQLKKIKKKESKALSIKAEELKDGEESPVIYDRDQPIRAEYRKLKDELRMIIQKINECEKENRTNLWLDKK